MCEASTLMLTSLALTAASGAAAYRQQSNTAKQQANAVETERALQQNDLVRQQDQQTRAASQEMNEQARQSLADAALFEVITGEYGGGNTANRGMAVMGIQQGEQQAVIGSNARTAAGETGFRSLAVQQQASSRIASISRPSAFGSLLTIASSATPTAYQYLKYQQAHERGLESNRLSLQAKGEKGRAFARQ